MKDSMSRVIMQRNYLVLFFIHGLFQMLKFSTAKSQDHIFKAPPVSSSLLCFSNCATCPYICSPPPAPPVMPSKSPRHLPPVTLSPPEPYNLDQPPPLPRINLSPPEPYSFDQPPPLPRISLSPPEPYYYDQPPPLPQINLSPPEPYYFDQPAPFLPAFPPPPSYGSWSNTPYAVSPPVPPNNVGGQGPPGTGQQRSFTFPYYYYNISQGGCISGHFAFIIHVIVCLAMFLAV